MTDTPPPHATPDGGDPSMEDILASIRRILNEDGAPVAPEKSVGAPAADDGVLILDQSMMVKAPHSQPTEPEPEPIVTMDDIPEPTAAPPETEPPVEAVAASPTGDPRTQAATPADLIAPETAAAAASSVGHLMRSLAAGRTTQGYSGGPTLEEIVRAELRPLLKEWLDENLPPMVERLVRAEIERVVGRAAS
jgi:cell pole-organizing protein PopZ